MIPRDFSLAYVDTVVSALRPEYSGDPSTGDVQLEGYLWSPRIENSLQRRLQELFYYETLDTAQRLRAEATDRDKTSSFLQRAVHFGLIKQDLLEVVARGLLLAETVVFQDLLYRTLSLGKRAMPEEDRRSQTANIALQLVRLRPLIDQGAVIFVPWLPQWEMSQFAAVLASQGGGSDDAHAVQVATMIGLQAATAVNGIPFTTCGDCHSHLTQIFANQQTQEENPKSRRIKTRWFDVSEYLQSDGELQFIRRATPHQILKVAKRHKRFRTKLREYFKEAIKEDGEQDFREQLCERAEDLKEELQKARESVKKARRKAWWGGAAVAVGGLAAGVSSLDTTQALHVSASGCGVVALTAGGMMIADFLRWVRDRIGEVSDHRTVVEGLLELQSLQEKEAN